jgi:hypothetical protein
MKKKGFFFAESHEAFMRRIRQKYSGRTGVPEMIDGVPWIRFDNGDDGWERVTLKQFEEATKEDKK